MITHYRYHRTPVQSAHLQKTEAPRTVAEPKPSVAPERPWISVRGLSAVFVVALVLTLTFNGV